MQDIILFSHLKIEGRLNLNRAREALMKKDLLRLFGVMSLECFSFLCLRDTYEIVRHGIFGDVDRKRRRAKPVVEAVEVEAALVIPASPAIRRVCVNDGVRENFDGLIIFRRNIYRLAPPFFISRSISLSRSIVGREITPYRVEE